MPSLHFKDPGMHPKKVVVSTTEVEKTLRQEASAGNYTQVDLLINDLPALTLWREVCGEHWSTKRRDDV